MKKMIIQSLPNLINTRIKMQMDTFDLFLATQPAFASSTQVDLIFPPSPVKREEVNGVTQQDKESSLSLDPQDVESSKVQWESARIPSGKSSKPVETPPSNQVKMDEIGDLDILQDDLQDDENDGDTDSEGGVDLKEADDLLSLTSECSDNSEKSVIPDLPYTAGRPLAKGFYQTGSDMMSKSRLLDKKIRKLMDDRSNLIEKGKYYMRYGKEWDKLLRKKNKIQAKKALDKIRYGS